MPDLVPVVSPGRLAIDTRWQRQGLGRSLFRDAALRVSHGAASIGVRGMVVHAISDDARKFYLALGFSECPGEPMTLVVTLPDIQASLGLLVAKSRIRVFGEGCLVGSPRPRRIIAIYISCTSIEGGRNYIIDENQTNKPTLIHPTPGQRGMTELHYAAYCNDPDAVRIQLQQDVFVDVRDDGGWTPLHWSIDMAQAGGQPEQVVELLLAAGASPDAVDRSECSALMMACGRNNEAILQQLIEAGADIYSRSRSGSTLLHEAAGCNFSYAIRRLLMLGLDPHQTDNRNQTPEQVAEYCGFDESTALLKAARLAR